QGNAIQADAGGLEGHEFVVFRHHAERDQYGDQRGQRRKLVEEIASKIDKIADDLQNAGAMLRDVVEQLEKRKDLEEEDESGGQQNKIVEEAAEQIHVEQLGDPGKNFPPRENASARRGAIAGALDALLLLRKTFPEAPARHPGKRSAQSAAPGHPLHLWQQKQAQPRGKDVCRPNACPDRYGALAR